MPADRVHRERARRAAAVGGILLAATLAAGAAPGALRAQAADSLAAPPSAPVEGTAIYDAGGRRDPFVPLTTELEPSEGPRFDSLKLTGVFQGTPGNSLAVLEDPSGRGYFLHVGETLGKARLIEIRPRSAVFQIEEYGTVRREVLELERTEEQP